MKIIATLLVNWLHMALLELLTLAIFESILVAILYKESHFCDKRYLIKEEIQILVGSFKTMFLKELV
jgi:hypothetical protein